MNIFQILAICGMMSPIVYTLMWIVGGMLRPEYSHIRDDVSSLMATGAPRKRLLDAFIITSSVLLFVFYLGVHDGINNGQGSMVGPMLLLASSILGICVALFFPLDAGGEFQTFRGKMHIVLIVASGILTIAGMVALWLRLESIEGWQAFATYSLLSAIVSLILVILAGIYANTKYRGIVERFMVTAYQLYYFVLALMVFLTN